MMMMSSTTTTAPPAAAAAALPPPRSRPPLPPSSAPQQQQPITASQVHRLLVALSGQVTELTGRVDLGVLQQDELRKELARMEVRLAAKADRRLTVLDRFALQPVPELTVDEWLAECDVGFWMHELYGGDLELLATVKPAAALTRVLDAFVAQWPRESLLAPAQPPASPVAAALAPPIAPPIRGMMVGKCRALYWFLATNWGAVTGASLPPPAPAAPAAPPATPAPQQQQATAQQQQQVIDGNASILLCGASVAPTAAAAAEASSVVMVDADAMSEITDDGGFTRPPGARTPHNNNTTNTPRATTTPRAAGGGGMMSVVAQQHLVPLEGVWHRMDIKKHWANIVTVLFQKYCEYMDRVSVRATKDQQLALLTGRAKCCNTTERSKMRMAFYDALAKIPGAILL